MTHAAGPDPTEQHAISRLKAGDIGGLEVLVRAHYVRAVRAAYLVTQDRPLAEDLVQAAFIRAYERIAQFDAARPFAPWFMRSVVNDAVKAVQRHRPALSLDHPAAEYDAALTAAGADLEAMIEQAETQDAVRAALAQLTPDLRATVVLRYFLGFKTDEIADAFDCPPGTVKWRLHRARQVLRDRLAALWRSRGGSVSGTASQRGEP
jgi:RNA polymerase sigma-70 factor (ECF subfamily)